MNSKQYALGRFETPLNVADLLVGLAVHRPADRVLDPGCGAGVVLERAAAWLRWLAASPPEPMSGSLYGVELDSEAIKEAKQRVPEAQISNQNFLGLMLDDLESFDAIIGNPPFTRAERIGLFEEEDMRQLPMFSWEDTPAQPDKIPLISHSLSTTLSGRSGLHTYFLVHCSEFLKEGGRLAFVVPNGWLDVAYGVELKQYLLDHYRIVAIIESAVERWFEEAWINTCIIVLEKCSNLPRRQGNLVHLARLKVPLQQLLPYSATSPHRFLAVEQLAGRLLAGQYTANDEAVVHVKEQRTLHPEKKWGMALRAPMIFRYHRDHLNLVPLKTWAQVQRGYTTGANEFFYLTNDIVEEWGIEEEFRQPMLKSLRGVDRLKLSADETQYEVLLIPPDTNLKGTAVADYIQWGEELQINMRRTCENRDPWYSLPIQPSAPLVMPKGVWHRHFAPLLIDDLAVDQQIYQICVADYLPLMVAAALLNSAWFALQVELRGRVSFGKGLLWLAAYELEEVQLPDPRQLAQAQADRLQEAFLRLANRPIGGSEDELARPDRRALDEIVFDLLGFSSQERAGTLRSLTERLNYRRQQQSA